MKVLARVTLVSLLSFAVHASAESRVCIGGDLDRLSPAQKSGCFNSASRVRSQPVTLHAPSDWHFFVVCTESDWQMYASFSKRKAVDLNRIGADTDIQNRTTFFRGEWLLASGNKGLNELVAHEVAAAVLQSADEIAIHKQVASWSLDSSENFSLQASR